MGGGALQDSVREALATGIPLMEMCNKLLFAIVSMTHSLLLTHSLVFPFSVLTVVICCFIDYIILLEVACELSRFCKMAHRSEVVGLRCCIE